MKNRNLRSTISLFIGITGRAYLIIGVVYLFSALVDGDIYKFLNKMTPFIGLVLAIALFGLHFLIAKTIGKVVGALSKIELKQSTFNYQIIAFLALGIIILMIVNEMNIKSQYQYTMFAMAYLDFVGIGLGKHSGIKGNGNFIGLKITLLHTLSVGAMIIAGIFLSKPISFVFQKLSFVIKAVFLFIGKIFVEIYTWFLNVLPKQEGSGVMPEEQFEYQIPEIDYIEPTPVSEILLKILFIVTIGAILITAIVMIAKYLLKTSFKKKGFELRGNSTKIQKKTLKERFNEIICKIKTFCISIIKRIKLMGHPYSALRLIEKIDHIVKKKPRLRKIKRENYDTLSEFLNRVASQYKGDAVYILEFNDFVNGVIYGKEKSWLVNYDHGHELMREIKQNL